MRRSLESNSNVIVIETEVGGHIGFIDSFGTQAYNWAERMSVEFANAVHEQTSSPVANVVELPACLAE
jgi:predicted alpha/beta-fold hydrolase